MLDWKEVAREYPEAYRYFASWVATKDILRGWGRSLRPGATLTAVPFEMGLGVVLVFFKEQDVLFSSDINLMGQLNVMGFRKNRFGAYVRFSVSKKKMDHLRAWAIAFGQGFALLERRIKGLDEVADSDMILGVDLPLPHDPEA